MDIDAKLGVPFEIRVEQLGSAGYQWQLRPLPPGVVLLGSDIAPPGPDDPPGSPGMQCFRFAASLAGRHVIALDRKRAWEAQAAATRSFTIEVR
jgi:predicted secreted protein